jgi:parallel beta-helix repeat protein
LKRSLIPVALAAVILLGAACVTSDKTNPVVSIVFPANGATVAKGSIEIKAVATDNKAVTKVEFYIGGTLKGTDNVGGAGDTFRYTWSDTAGQVVGQNYSLVAKAYDKAENDASSTAVSITIAGGGGGTGPTEHSQDIVGGDSIWYPSGNPHIVTRKLDIGDNGKLTIMPGCIVKFATGAGFVVGSMSAGELQAVGKPGADSMIYFTSNAATPNPGDWDGFDFFGSTRTTTRFSYCDINYGGYADYGAISLDWGGTIKMDHTTIRNAPKYGIWAGDFSGYIDGFTGNTITACGSYPIYIGAANMSKMTSGNTLTGNAIDAIYLSSGAVTETGTWLNHGVPYVLGTNLDIGADAGPVLTIESGTTLKFASGNHLALGYTVPAGLIANNVTFTSASASPQEGDWTGISFWGASIDAQCRLTNCTIAYGGGDEYGNVYIDDAVPTVTGCTIRDSKGWGVYLESSEYPDPDTLLANNTFSNNRLGDVRRP